MATPGKPDSDRPTKTSAEKPREGAVPVSGSGETDRPATEKSAKKSDQGSALVSDSGAKSSLPPFLRLFVSSTARQANAMRKHVEKLVNHQRDILAPNAMEAVEGGIRDMKQSLASGTSDAGLKKQMESLEVTANKWLKPYPNAVWRENIEVLLVALSVAMAVRTFFIQPFKIPTGSMQPTLFGVTSKNLLNEPDFKVPSGMDRVRDWFAGTSYIHIVAENDGALQVEPPVRLLIFNLWQTIVIGGKSQTIWLPPDFGAGQAGTLEARAGLHNGQVFRKGDDVVKLEISAGDHLFVDRVTYNFRPPGRGEIIVFETHGITGLDPSQQDTFYIKRLVGLGGETLSLQQDFEVMNVPMAAGPVPVGHLLINGQPLSASTPHFENLYSFNGADRSVRRLNYHENHYFGHALLQNLSLGQEFRVEPGSLFVMGDNTMNSSDSRYWGDFPREKVIGRSFFVYWPITKRFGWTSSTH